MHTERGGGGASLSQLILFPVTLLALFSAVEVGLWYSAREAAAAAAMSCATAQRVVHPTGVTSTVHQVANRHLRNIHVAVSDDGVTVRCEVSGTPAQVIDLGLDPIRQSVTLPKERVS